jgi:hypothetical protein
VNLTDSHGMLGNLTVSADEFRIATIRRVAGM